MCRVYTIAESVDVVSSKDRAFSVRLLGDNSSPQCTVGRGDISDTDSPPRLVYIQVHASSISHVTSILVSTDELGTRIATID